MARLCKKCKYSIPNKAHICAHCGADQRPILGPLWKIISSFVIIATLIMAIGILGQTLLIKRTFELENRPYLYVDIEPVVFSHREKIPNTNEEYDNLFVGATLKYKNVGKIPACNIESNIYFYSDVDKGNNFDKLKDWYIEEFGYFPEPTTIFPHQEGQKIPCRVDCSESTKEYMFSIRITYTGENPDKAYWYATDVNYSIEKASFKQGQSFIRKGNEIVQTLGNKEYSVYIVKAESDYDRDRKSEILPPAIRPY